MKQAVKQTPGEEISDLPESALNLHTFEKGEHSTTGEKNKTH